MNIVDELPNPPEYAYPTSERPVLQHEALLVLHAAGQALSPGGGDLFENHRQRLGNPPRRIVRSHFSQIAVVADMVAHSAFRNVAPTYSLARIFLGRFERFQNRAGIFLSSSQVVNLRAARRLPELVHEARHVFGVDVVAHLLSLVSEYLVLAPLYRALHQVT